MFPLLFNVVVKIFLYRIEEVINDPTLTTSLTTVHISTFSELISPQNHNFILLCLYGLSLIFTILYHAFRVIKLLVVNKRAYVLALLTLLKTLLLLFDLITVNFLLYETLVAVGVLGGAFNNSSVLVKYVLSVVVPGSWVSLSTNVLVNWPLHYYFLKLQLRNATNSMLREMGVSNWSLLRVSLGKTFHPVISVRHNFISS